MVVLQVASIVMLVVLLTIGWGLALQLASMERRILLRIEALRSILVSQKKEEKQ